MTKAMPIKSYFQGTKAKRQFFAGEELVAYDVNQLLDFERGFRASRMALITSVATLLSCWKRARDSWKRVAEALPAGKLREEMFEELRKREASMDLIAEQARADLYAAVVEEDRANA